MVRQAVQVQVAQRTRLGKPWPMFELFHDKMAPHVKVIQDWLRPIVREALEKKAAAARGEETGEGTFLSHLTNSTDSE